MRVNRFLVPILAVTLFLGTVGVAMANGAWIVSGKQMVDVESMTSSADIKGWMTLQQVADGFGLSTDALYALAAIPADLPPETALKDLEGVVPDFEVTALREAVAAYIGEDEATSEEPASGEAEAPMANEAATPAIEATATVTPEEVPSSEAAATATATPQPDFTPDYVPTGGGVPDGDGTGPTPVPEGIVLAADQIKGRHTLQTIADEAQVPLEELIAALGLPADQDPGATVKDLVGAGLVTEMDVVRSVVAGLQE